MSLPAKIFAFAFAFAACSLCQFCEAQSTLLDGVQHLSTSFEVNDVVYDHKRDVLYASIPSTAGFPNGNSIATIDPTTGSILSSTFVGSEPNALAISDDASRVYVGIDGATSFRYWQPGDNQLGALRPLSDRGPAVAHNLAVVPGRPDTIVVSVDVVSNTGSGELQVFNDISSATATPFFHDSNHIGFLDSTTLFGFDDSNTGFTGRRFDLNGLNLTQAASQNSLIGSFSVESEVGRDGLVYFTNGATVDAATLQLVGTYSTGLDSGEALVQPISELGLTYFVGTDGGADINLSVFDSDTFLQIDSIDLPISSSEAKNRGEFIFAGQDRLAFLWKSPEFAGQGGPGILNIISGIPSVVPEPSATVFLALSTLLFGTTRFRKR